MDKSLRFLESVKDNLQYVEYDLIYQSIAEIRGKPITTALINKGHIIDRVRINYGGEIFLTHEQVSYIHDPSVIEKLDFGRANKQKQAVFYGSIVSPEIQYPRLVAYLETTKKLKNGKLDEEFMETFTLTRWRVLKTFIVIEVAFSPKALAESSYAREALKNQEKNIPQGHLREHYMQQLLFFSDEFSKQSIKTPSDYKISAAYANYIWDNSNLGGITYASVPSGYKGQNVCLLPQTVQTHLKLEKAAMFEVIKRKNHPLHLGDCFKYCDEFGVNNMNFHWRDYSNGIII